MFTVDLFVSIYLAYLYIFHLYYCSIAHMFFSTVLAVCILGTPSSFTLSVSTPLSPCFYPIGCHHAYWLLPCRTFQILRYKLLAFFLSFLLRLLTRKDGIDTLTRYVGKQLPHDAT
jgi:hypothetical protein